MQQQTQQRNAFPGSLSDLVASFENVKQKGEQILGMRVCVIILMLTGNGNSGTSDDKFGPGAQIAGWRVLEHAAATGH
jgi:hypothetical protein